MPDKTHLNKTEEVDKFISKMDSSFKKEVEFIRSIIKNCNKEITEQIKWNAPTFSYHDEYLVTFNLHSKDRIMLVFHHPKTPLVKSELLEGDYKDGRRLVYLADMNDVKTKKAELEQIIKELIRLTK